MSALSRQQTILGQDLALTSTRLRETAALFSRITHPILHVIPTLRGLNAVYPTLRMAGPPRISTPRSSACQDRCNLKHHRLPTDTTKHSRRRRMTPTLPSPSQVEVRSLLIKSLVRLLVTQLLNRAPKNHLSQRSTQRNWHRHLGMGSNDDFPHLPHLHSPTIPYECYRYDHCLADIITLIYYCYLLLTCV